MSGMSRRVLAILVTAVFLVVVLATTIVSVGRYCLTSDGGDTRCLPASGDR